MLTMQNVLTLHYELHSDTVRNTVLCESRLLEVPVFINLSIVLASHYPQHMNILPF